MAAADDGADWDDDKAAEMIGRTVLIGLTYKATTTKELHREQMYGTIVAARQAEGVAVALRGSDPEQPYWLPPVTKAFERARPGSYTLHSTRETIVDPDYVTTWTITPPDDPVN